MDISEEFIEPSEMVSRVVNCFLKRHEEHFLCLFQADPYQIIRE